MSARAELEAKIGDLLSQVKALGDCVIEFVAQRDAALLQNGAWEKLVRAAADQLYALGKQLRGGEEAATGETIQVIATEMHRECGVIKGEKPLPHAGARLTEKPLSDTLKQDTAMEWLRDTDDDFKVKLSERPKCDHSGIENSGTGYRCAVCKEQLNGEADALKRIGPDPLCSEKIPHGQCHLLEGHDGPCER